MKAYRVWTDSTHLKNYTLGYFERRDDAQSVLESVIGPYQTMSGPASGIEEIEITPASGEPDEEG